MVESIIKSELNERKKCVEKVWYKWF